MAAARNCSLEAIDVLLRLGADPNILNINNNSALWYALDSNNNDFAFEGIKTCCFHQCGNQQSIETCMSSWDDLGFGRC